MTEPDRASNRAFAADAAIGSQLRAERLRRDLSLRELARRLGVSASLISQVETGKSKPSVSTLYLIVTELGISLDQLLARAGQATDGPAGGVPHRPGTCPVQRGDRRQVIELDSGVCWERLTAGPDPEVDFLYCTYDVGGASGRDGTLMRHPGKEYGLVVHGRLAVTIGFDRYELDAGDSVSFDSTVPHLYQNAGDVPVQLVVTVVGRHR